MRKITKLAAKAFEEKKPFKLSNTEVRIEEGKPFLFLFGKLIAKENSFGHTVITLAGWNTPTTRERLKAVGARVCTKKGQAMVFNGKDYSPISNTLWYGVRGE